MEAPLDAARVIIETARRRLAAMPDCRNKSVALTHLDNAEVMSQSPLLNDDMERAAEASRFLTLASGFEDRASRGPG